MDFHVQNIGNRHVWSLWHRFYGNKWKKINIWQPCDPKSGNPVGRGISKISQFDFLVLNMSTCRFWSLWHRFYGKKWKNWISGNPVMQNLATLLVVGLWKCHQSISRAKKPTRGENFVKILNILCVSNFETIVRNSLTLHAARVASGSCQNCQWVP